MYKNLEMILISIGVVLLAIYMLLALVVKPNCLSKPNDQPLSQACIITLQLVNR